VQIDDPIGTVHAPSVTDASGRLDSDGRPATLGKRSRPSRSMPRDNWQIVERPDLRVVPDALWERVQERRTEVRQEWGIYAGAARTLVKGRKSSLYSTQLFGGLLTCAVCAGPVGIIDSSKGWSRYGCSRHRRLGPQACENRLTVKSNLADQALLARLQAELLRPETLQYVTNGLAAALSRALDERPRLRGELEARRDAATRKLANLARAVEEGGAMPTLLQAIARHEADLRATEAELGELEEPLEDRMAVMPRWVQ
jgi:site-specific DNA recombinase